MPLENYEDSPAYKLDLEKAMIESGWYDSEDEHDFRYHGQSLEYCRRRRLENVAAQISALN